MSEKDTHMKAGPKNGKVAYVLVATVACMLGLAYASVPLYQIFCQVTGYGGTPRQIDVAFNKVIDREVTVQFSANLNKDMPWDFAPKQRDQHMKIGEQRIAYFEAYNPTDKAITGLAVFNVTPHKAGSYFNKIDCFCFTEQTLQPGERVDMPVVYTVDPEIDQDRNLDEVKEITLSYTFYVSEDEKATGGVGH